LHSVAVSDALVKRLGGSVSCTTRTLAAGASTTCRSGSVQVTRTQADNGVFRNQATGTAVDPTGAAVVSPTTTATLAVQRPAGSHHHKHKGHHHKGHHHKGHKGHHHKGHKGHHHKGHKGHHRQRHHVHQPAIKLRMTQYILAISDVNRNGHLEHGDSVRFGFHLVNEGTQSLQGIRIVDRRLSRFHLSASCVSTALAPGDSTVCTSEPMKITRYQEKKGLGRNFAYAVATSGGTSVRSNSTVVTLQSDVRALPDTGSDLTPLRLWVAAFLLLGGAVLAGAGRLRRRSVAARTPSAQR
jgi:hypothetical protein